MQRERWQEIERLYYLALEREPELRSEFLAKAAGEDRELLEEVETLLKQSDTDSRLDRPVWAGQAVRTRLGPYEIEALLGAGGMGEVFRARDPRLKRAVAIKVSKQRFTDRFKREARAAAALSHPNIVQIYELNSSDGEDYLVMEFVPGRTLAELISESPLSIDEILAWARQIASALAVAHAAGIVHRDIKPANIIVKDRSLIKILDFGLAKYEQSDALNFSVKITGPQTGNGVTLGTPSYMSPEQVQGKPTDARSDIFSCGAVLYEIFTGRRAFAADSLFGILNRVVNDTPADIRKLRPEVPAAIAAVIAQCLEKDPARRYSSGTELANALNEADRRARSASRLRRTRAVLAASLIAIAGMSIWFYVHNQRVRWAREELLPKIQEHILQSDYFGAFALTRAALRQDPDNPQLKQHWENVSLPLTMTTDPPGAKVSVSPFGSADLPWELVGNTPLERAPVPFANLRVRIEKEGMEPLEFSAFTIALQGQTVRLFRAGSIPVGMVAVPERAPPVGPVKVMHLPDFFLDKFEVTNRQFQGFVDSGGYRTRKYWRYPFSRNGREASWEQAVAGFRDTTGRPGPAFWELGTFPKEQAGYPVAGVSWFEAAAYCESVGKSLPTMYHWQKAAGFGLYSDILFFSNFTHNGPMPVGVNPGITPFGAYDMAGNVKEWVLNQVGDRRLILGGSFGEQSYPFDELDAQDPFARLPTFGIRCASYPVPVPPEALLPVAPTGRNDSTRKPVGNDTFEIFRRIYAYEKNLLAPKVERIDDSNALWRTERISYAAPYGGERISAYLFLPKNVKAPYQTVLFVPGGWAFVMRSSLKGVSTDQFDFLLRTGRAVLYPVYKGTFERHVENLQSPNVYRETTIQVAKDAFRSLDYLETRSDVQISKLGYYGMSFGGTLGPVVLALDSRLRAGVLNPGALYSDKVAPEIDILNFAPHVQAPVLMIGGRYDFVASPEMVQKPVYRLLGTRTPDKRFLQFDSGHIPPLRDVMRESLNWFDHYLGPVTPSFGAR